AFHQRGARESRTFRRCAARSSRMQAPLAPDAIATCAALRAGWPAAIPANPRTTQPTAARPTETSPRLIAESTTPEPANRGRAATQQRSAIRSRTQFFHSRAPPRQPAAAPAAFQSLLRHLHCSQHFSNGAIRRQSFEISLGLQQNAVTKHGGSGRFHIVRYQKIAAFHSSQRARHSKKSNRGSRTCAKRNGGEIARAADEIDKISVKRRLDANLRNLLPRCIQDASLDR